MSRFFVHEPRTLSEISALCDVTYIGPDKMITDVKTLSEATATSITFCQNPKYKDALGHTKAAACFVRKDFSDCLPSYTAALITDKPYRCLAQTLKAMYKPTNALRQNGQWIHPTAKIGKDCVIGPGVIIESGAEIGEGSVLEGHIFIGYNCVIGKACTIHSHVSITYAHIGDNVVIKHGAKIGQEGFGFEIDPSGMVDVPQLGTVIIGDNTKIGANTTIDRGSLSDTVIGCNCRIDNLVQIAHNVRIGNGVVIVAQVGIAGSTQIGDHTVIAGQAGIAGHLNIGTQVTITARSGVMQHIQDGMKVAGTPAVPSDQFFRDLVKMKKILKSYVA